MLLGSGIIRRRVGGGGGPGPVEWQTFAERDFTAMADVTTYAGPTSSVDAVLENYANSSSGAWTLQDGRVKSNNTVARTLAGLVEGDFAPFRARVTGMLANNTQRIVMRGKTDAVYDARVSGKISAELIRLAVDDVRLRVYVGTALRIDYQIPVAPDFWTAVDWGAEIDADGLITLRHNNADVGTYEMTGAEITEYTGNMLFGVMLDASTSNNATNGGYEYLHLEVAS